MIKTREDVTDLAAEICPECDDTRVMAVELGWFVLELERGDELRDGAEHGAGAEASAVEFRCRSCGSHWS